MILAAGRGTRVGETSDKIAGRPLLENSLICAVSAGIEEIVLVVGYQAEDIIHHYGIFHEGRRIKYVIQHAQQGLVGGMEHSKSVVGAAVLALFLGEEFLIAPRHKEIAYAFESPNLFAFCGAVRRLDRRKSSRTYALLQDDNRQIYRLIEKPRSPNINSPEGLKELEALPHCKLNKEA